MVTTARPFSFTFEHVPDHGPAFSCDDLTKAISNHSRGEGNYDFPESIFHLPYDERLFDDVRQTAESLWNTRLKFVVVVGIGGAYLGTKAIYDALVETSYAETRKGPRIIFLDTISGQLLANVRNLLDTEVKESEELVINLVSKSGTTSETIANFELLREWLLPRFPDIDNRIVITTESGGKLWELSERLKIRRIDHRKVGGRFSVLSPVGLLPLLLVGVNIEQMRKGAREQLEHSLNKDNSALRAAQSIAASRTRGISIIDFFFFNPELESFGKWCRQLYAESLGKEIDRSGRTVRAGMTPTVSIGSTDLHSMAQLYLGGPKDKFTLFLYSQISTHEKVSPESPFASLVPSIADKSPEQIMSAIYGGTIGAYKKHKLPFGEIHAFDISAYSLGALTIWHMLVVLYLSRAWNVDPFDQPNVEDYKQITKEILSHNN
jgi:glucose-6-phosphate isomerase